MLNSKFSLKEMDVLHFFLGIESREFESEMLLKQSKYIKSLLTKEKLTDV